MMKRNSWNFLIDSLMLIAFGGLVYTGFIIYFILPPGSGGRHAGGLELWGLSRHDFGGIHSYFAVGLLGLAALHLFLHWRWVLATLFGFIKVKDRKAYYQTHRATVLGFLFTFTLIFLLSATLMVAKADVTKRIDQIHHTASKSYQTNRSVDIKGWMTINEIAEHQNLPALTIIKTLDLPEDVSREVGIGKIAREAGQTVSGYRLLLSNLAK